MKLVENIWVIINRMGHSLFHVPEPLHWSDLSQNVRFSIHMRPHTVYDVSGTGPWPWVVEILGLEASWTFANCCRNVFRKKWVRFSFVRLRNFNRTRVAVSLAWLTLDFLIGLSKLNPVGDAGVFFSRLGNERGKTGVTWGERCKK